MKRISLDPREYDGYAWPAHCYSLMKEAGFKLKPLMTVAPTGGDVIDALEQPWQITRSPIGVLTVVQSD